MNARKFFGFILSAVTLISLCSSEAFAMTYADDYPDYISYSGGAYVEIYNPTLQRCSAVFPIDYQKRTFSFNGDSNVDIVNSTRSTINGKLFLPNGQTYDCRLTSLSSLEYRVNSSYGSDWQPLTVTEIYNTNIVFDDFKGLNRQNDNPYFSIYEKISLSFSFLTILFLVVFLFTVFIKKVIK